MRIITNFGNLCIVEEDTDIRLVHDKDCLVVSILAETERLLGGHKPWCKLL